MKTIEVKPAQTLFDVALEQYGNSEAAGEILRNNPGLQNDPAALSALGIDAVSNDGFYIDAPLLEGSSVEIDTESGLIKNNVLKQINSEITTFDV